MFDDDPYPSFLVPTIVPRRSRYSASRHNSRTGLIIVLITAGLLCCGLALVLLAIRPQQDKPEIVSPSSAAPWPAEAPITVEVLPPQQPTASGGSRESIAEVRVISARIGYVKLIATAPAKSRPKTIFDLDRDEEYRSVDKLLSVEIEIGNSGQRPVDYRSWSTGGVSLADELGRPCVLGRFADARPEGGCGDVVSIPAGGSIRDVLVFQPPSPPSQDLRLHLRGQNLGLDQAVRLLIPARSIESAEGP